MPFISLTIDGDEQPLTVSVLELTYRDSGDSVPGVTLPDGFVTAGGGDWQFNFDDDTNATRFRYMYRLNWVGGTFTELSGELDTTSTGYTGRYTTSTAVVTFIKSENLNVLADVDGNEIEDDGAVQQAIESGESDVDTFLGGPVESFTADVAGTSARQLLNMVSYKFATFELAAKRGLTANEGNPYLQIKADAEEAITRFAAKLYGVTIVTEDPDSTPDVGQFRSIAITRGTCDSDEYSRDY